MDENIVKLIITLIGIVTAIITASLSYYFAKKQRLEADERRLKEKYYLAYIQAVNDIVVVKNKERARNSLADAQNQLLLIGSADVVTAVLKFHDYVKPSGQEEQGFNAYKHDFLFTEIMKAMRKDLYKKKRIKKNYPIIHLTGDN